MQVGGDAVGLLERSEPDVVLNAVVGFAGVGATLWALEHGVTLALANKESLVAAGELAIGARRRGEGLLLPVDSEHSALWQCLEGRDSETVAGLVLTASGGPFRGRSRAELTDVTAADALAHPTWNMGPKITVDSATLANKGLELIEAHWLFELPYDRIEVVVHPTSVVHALARFRDGALLAHVGLPDMRVPISYALTYPDRAATPVPQLDLVGLDLSFEAADLERSRCSRSPARAASEGDGAVRLQRSERGGRRGVPRRPHRVPRDRGDRRGDAVTRRRRRRSRPRRPDGGRRRGPQPGRERAAAGMTIFIAILGLGILILVHELGHFVASLALGMRPRRFYIGFPPAILKTTRNGIEYGIGAIPLGGFVKIPGMHRPAPVDVDSGLSRALEEEPSLSGATGRLRNALAGGDHDAARDSLRVLRELVAEKELSPQAASSAQRALDELGDALGPDAYWRAPTWKRVTAIAAGPAANILLALVLFTGLYMTSVGKATTTVDEISAGSPAQSMGMRAGDRIQSIDGGVVQADDISAVISGSDGRQLTVVVVRDGRQRYCFPRPRRS